LVGVSGGGRLKLEDNISSSFSSSFCASTTGRVTVRTKTLGAATIPRSFSQIFLLLQLPNVGNRVPKKILGEGSILPGHQRGALAWSRVPRRCSLGKSDSGDALGDGSLRLGVLGELRPD
jgi:hypothetical protein